MLYDGLEIARLNITFGARVLEAGKNLLLYADIGELEFLLGNLPQRGLALMVDGAASEEHAKEALRAARHPLA